MTGELTGRALPHVETRGDASGIAIVFLHGFLSSNRQWEPHRAHFDARYRWSAVELWGHGDSPAPAQPSAYTAAAYVDALETVREMQGVDRWIVVGQSFGAGLTIRYALAHPERVRGLVITNSVSAFSDVAKSRGTPDRDAVAKIDLRALPYHPAHAKRFPSELRERMSEVADRTDRTALYFAMSETTRSTCCRDDVSRLEVPTLLVNGTRERGFQPHRDFAAATIPGIQVVDLDAGHAVNVEAPREFEVALARFVETAEVGRRG